MGKYYRTSSATPLDYMYKVDAPLMERAVAAQEGFIDQTLADDTAIGQAAKFNYAPQDTEAASKIIQDYTGQTEAISQAIMRDPVNYRKQQGAISGLKRKLINDYTTGAISKYVGNYEQRKANMDALSKQVELYQKTGGKDKQGNAVGIAPENAAKYMQHWDEQFKGTNYDPSRPLSYNKYAASSAMNDMDIKKELSEGVAKMKADGTLVTRTGLTGGEEYFNKQTKEYEALTPARILDLVSSNFIGNQKLQNYIRERSSIGAMHGMVYQDDVLDPKTGSVVHEKGDIIAPYEKGIMAISPEEQHALDARRLDADKIKNPLKKKEALEAIKADEAELKNRPSIEWSQSGLAPIFRSIIGENAFSKTKDIQELKGGTNWGAKFRELNANARHSANIAQQERMSVRLDTRARDLAADLNADRDADRALKEKMFDWKAAGGGATGTGKKATPLPPAPAATAVSDLTTNSFSGKLTKDNNGQTVNMLSVEGAIGDLTRSKEEIANYDAQIAKNKKTIAAGGPDANSAKVANEELVLKRAESQKIVDTRRDWIAKATDVVLSNSAAAGTPLTPQEIALHHEFANDVQGIKYKEHIKELEKQHPKIPVSANAKEVARQEQELAAEKKSLAGYDMNDRNTREVAAPKQRQKIRVLEAEINARKSRLDATSYTDAPEVVAARKKLTDFYTAENRINKNRNNVFAQMRKEYINTNSIIPTAKESVELWDMVMHNPYNSEVFDEMGNKTATNVLSSGFGFGGKRGQGEDFSTGLAEYVKANDVEVQVTNLGASTNLGNGGAVMEVRFNDPTGRLSDKPRYIALSPQMTQAVSTKFSKHANPAVAKIAGNIGNDEFNSIRNQIAQPRIGSVTGDHDAEKTFDVIIAGNTGDKMPIHVTRFPDSERIEVRMTDPRNPGKTVPFLNSKGSFANIDDFLQHYADVKQNGDQSQFHQ